MIRSFALVGDTHADEHSRLAEHDRIMSWIGRDAAERGVSGFLHSGDVWERDSTGRERLAVADWAMAWAEHAPVAIVRGNHDNPLDIEWLGRLRTRHPLHAVTRPGVIEFAGASVACLPWPQPAEIYARASSVGEGNQAARVALQDVLRGLGDRLDSLQILLTKDSPRILLAHAMMRGSRTCLAQPPLVGCDFEVGAEDLMLVRAAFYGLGHIHLGPGNEWDVDGAPAAFPGSPRRCNFGETDPKGYIIVTFDGGRLVGWERIPTPATEMRHVDAEWFVDPGVGAGLTMVGGWRGAIANARGAEVRLRFRVPVDQREQARAQANELADKMRAAGAVSVLVEEVVIAEKRARAPEVAAATTLADKAAAHWESIKFDPGARRPALIAKLNQLEEETRDAA